jgi:hypothetical protein
MFRRSIDAGRCLGQKIYGSIEINKNTTNIDNQLDAKIMVY